MLCAFLFNLIAGYSGFIPGVVAENQYGGTFSTETHASLNNKIPRGIDQPAHLKFQTTATREYVKHDATTKESVSQIVGVHRDQDTYQKVSTHVRLSLILGVHSLNRKALGSFRLYAVTKSDYECFKKCLEAVSWPT